MFGHSTRRTIFWRSIWRILWPNICFGPNILRLGITRSSVRYCIWTSKILRKINNARWLHILVRKISLRVIFRIKKPGNIPQNILDWIESNTLLRRGQHNPSRRILGRILGPRGVCVRLQVVLIGWLRINRLLEVAWHGWLRVL